jgi:hypothetical protein
MSRTAAEPGSRAAQVSFELDQFDLIDGDRCEVRGRWLGVRGRRFLRPALTLTVDGHSRRLLADLADKPWHAEDGSPWHASFPCDLSATDLAAAELTVAPDLTVELQLPRRSRSRSGAGRAARAPAPPARDRADASATPSPLVRRSRADAGERLRRELVDARNEQRRLQSQVDHVRAENGELTKRITGLVAHIGGLERQLAEVTGAREQLAANLLEQRAKRGKLAAERNDALRRLEEMTVRRDAARYDHDELLRKLDASQTAHRQTLASLDRALADRDAAAVGDGAAPARSRPAAGALHGSAEVVGDRTTGRPPPDAVSGVVEPAPLALRADRARGAHGYARSWSSYATVVVALLVVALLLALIVLRP